MAIAVALDSFPANSFGCLSGDMTGCVQLNNGTWRIMAASDYPRHLTLHATATQ